MFNKARYRRLEMGKAEACFSDIVENTAEAYSALPAWENGHPNIYVFSFSAFATAKSHVRHMKCYACSQDLVHLLFSHQPSSLVKLWRTSWSRCQQRCISTEFCWGFSEQVAGSLLSRWAFSCQQSSRMKFPSLETPLCCCVAKGFCRLFYCLNSHQICIIIQA